MPCKLASLTQPIKKHHHLNWHDQLRSELQDLKIECHFFLDDGFITMWLADGKIRINLVDLKNQFKPADLIGLQEKYAHSGIRLIHLWEDLWLSRSKQVLARIASLLGLNARIHGRKTKIIKITKPVADKFINENHLQGTVNSRYKFGLMEGEELVAVATFSALRKMNHTENYQSAELIRFAVKAGFTVTGGLSKLIVHFATLLKPNDLMTYADRDWSAGAAYNTLGFTLTGMLAPKQFVLSENLSRVLSKNEAQTAFGATVFNTGSFKFILRF